MKNKAPNCYKCGKLLGVDMNDPTILLAWDGATWAYFADGSIHLPARTLITVVRWEAIENYKAETYR